MCFIPILEACKITALTATADYCAGTAARVFSDIADYEIILFTIKASREVSGLSAT